VLDSNVTFLVLVESIQQVNIFIAGVYRPVGLVFGFLVTMNVRVLGGSKNAKGKVRCSFNVRVLFWRLL
jgi:hypothetical protein